VVQVFAILALHFFDIASASTEQRDAVFEKFLGMNLLRQIEPDTTRWEFLAQNLGINPAQHVEMVRRHFATKTNAVATAAKNVGRAMNVEQKKIVESVSLANATRMVRDCLMTYSSVVRVPFFTELFPLK